MPPLEYMKYEDDDIEPEDNFLTKVSLPKGLGFIVKAIEPVFEEDKVVMEDTVKSLVKLVRKGRTLEKACELLEIDKEELEELPDDLKKRMLQLIEEATLEAKDRQKLSRALTNKIATEATDKAQYDTALEAIKLMNLDPEVDIQPRIQLPGGSIMGGDMIELLSRIGSDNKKVIEGDIIEAEVIDTQDKQESETKDNSSSTEESTNTKTTVEEGEE